MTASQPHARYINSNTAYGSFDDSTLPSKIRDRVELHQQSLEENPAFYSDSEQTVSLFNEFVDYSNAGLGSHKGTGRLRKKIASRSKGGAFVEKKQKRRIYSCCIGSEIDTTKLHDFFADAADTDSTIQAFWDSELYTDTLHISRKVDVTSGAYSSPNEQQGGVTLRPSFQSVLLPISKEEKVAVPLSSKGVLSKSNFSAMKEIFVFEFGAVVFWGFSAGEESDLLKLIQQYVTIKLTQTEILAISDDDMAFALVDDTEISIVSDIVCLHENTVTQQRLAVSFALSQSVILSLLESQVEIKIPEYNHIPITLATAGRIRYMTSADVGKLIGELFVIRHNLNLHTDILDTPDYFWDEDRYKSEYLIVWKYLEMDIRVEVLNKRLDMIKELLDLLRFHVERSEMTNLDWIIIILIVVYCFVEVGGILL